MRSPRQAWAEALGQRVLAVRQSDRFGLQAAASLPGSCWPAEEGCGQRGTVTTTLAAIAAGPASPGRCARLSAWHAPALPARGPTRSRCRPPGSRARSAAAAPASAGPAHPAPRASPDPRLSSACRMLGPRTHRRCGHTQDGCRRGQPREGGRSSWSPLASRRRAPRSTREARTPRRCSGGGSCQDAGHGLSHDHWSSPSTCLPARAGSP